MSGLANINRALAVVSQNVTNANTPGYVHETLQQTDATAGGLPEGVITGLTVRDIDPALQQQLMAQNASTAGASVTSTALAQIDAVQGKPGAGQDLASLVATLGNGFSTLLNDPSSAAQQQQVVSQAQTLANQLQTTSTAVQTQRQNAQNQLVANVSSLNADLQAIGALNKQIMQTRASGGSTADLENQRDAAMQTASSQLDLRFVAQPSGDMTVLTASGLQLSTGPTPALSVNSANLGPTSYYPGGGAPAVTINGTDVTASLNSGAIGADLTLRDTTLPVYQGTLDGFAQTLASRFAGQGLALFTDASGNVPQPAAVAPTQSPYIGFAGIIQVNPAVVANPALVRDGTTPIAAGAGGATAFTPNPVGGPAGYSVLITRVLNYALTGQVAQGVPQPTPSLTQMGPTGNLNATIAAPTAIGDFATALVASQAADTASASNAATGATDTQAALQQSIAQKSGVSLDTELAHMVQLQNAYAANAHVISALQTLWTQLMQTIQ
jgi:flagellar hook-associated protein 1 FlgK